MKKILLFLVIFSLFLASCTMSGSPFGRGGYSFTDVDYFTGTQGLKLSFLEQAPPEKVFEGAPLDVQILVENKGAFDIVDNYTASFKITFDSLEMLKQTGNYEESIEPAYTGLQIYGKSPSYPDGENYYLFGQDNEFYYAATQKDSLSFNAKPIVANFEKNTATFYATTCYPYKTYFSDDICIDKDPQNIDPRRKVCQAEDHSYSKGQGAPVAITAVETNMVPKGTYVLPQFVIHIEHNGRGIVSDFDVINDQQLIGVCGDVTSETVNALRIDAYLGQDKLVCFPEIVRLREGEAEPVCKLEENSIDLVGSNYLAPLRIELSYLYTDTISKNIIVERTRPLNLFEETVVNEDFCHAWETFISDNQGNRCESNCKYYADTRNAQPFREVATNDPANNPLAYKWPILQQGTTVQETESAWKALNCVYGNEATCRQNPSSCMIDKNLCQPGSFCGWPKCFERNQKPQVEQAEITDSFLTWSCRDGDDNSFEDPQQTCGCEQIAYWTLVEKATWSTLVGPNKAPDCKNLPEFKYLENIVAGVYDPVLKRVNFRTTSPSYNQDDTAICVKVIDKQGNADFVRVTPQITQYFQ